jgi:hypothetical protein
VEIRRADPERDKNHHELVVRSLMEEVKIANTTILLGPDVVLDYSGVTNLSVLNGVRVVHPLLDFGPCVTLMGVGGFDPGTAMVEGPAGKRRPSPVAGEERRVGLAGQQLPPARTPRWRGPLLRFGASRAEAKIFIGIRCIAGFRANDSARISGFRLEGPSSDQQWTEETGIFVERCVDIEISNMEISGWGGAAIDIRDEKGGDQGPVSNPSNLRGGRISQAQPVKIFHNFIHHNQHPSESESYYSVGGYAAGYGVGVGPGAWAEIFENVFDANRHAIASEGGAGGYNAFRNLVLKGGGVHGRWYNQYTHIFDAHGTGCWWSEDLCGDAGTRFLYQHNAFQYRNGPAIKIRGRPLSGINIFENVFPHDNLKEGWGDDAVHLQTSEHISFIPGIGGRPNVTGVDSYGEYGVCDFDGDGVDDLFLATGVTWWYSSFGELHWSFLNARRERLKEVRFGYFDNDRRCDVLIESDGQWLIFSGGSGAPRSIGAFSVALSEVAFGQFDPGQRDHRPGVTRRTTHVLKREADGQWQVTALWKPDGTPVPDSVRVWRAAQSSSKPMSELRFGDFTGDGVTDVLAVVDGRWAISESAIHPWRNLNPHLGKDVNSADLFIVDLNHDNVDDIVGIERILQLGVTRDAPVSVTCRWWVSDKGSSEWRGPLKTYNFVYQDGSALVRSLPLVALAGRFGVAPGGGVLLVGPDRRGRFYSEAEEAAGASPDWLSVFPY